MANCTTMSMVWDCTLVRKVTDCGERIRAGPMSGGMENGKAHEKMARRTRGAQPAKACRPRARYPAI